MLQEKDINLYHWQIMGWFKKVRTEKSEVRSEKLYDPDTDLSK